jgi:hypothetical protein
MTSILEAMSGLALTVATDADYACDSVAFQRPLPVPQSVADQGRILFGAGFRLPVDRKTS